MKYGIFSLSLFVYAMLTHGFAQQGGILSFNAQAGAGCSIFLQWTAYPGSDTFDFAVERSPDGKRWNQLSIQLHGITHRYTAFDNDPAQGSNYYRIRALIHADTSVVSEVKWVLVNRNTEIFIWPDLSENLLYVKTPFYRGEMDIIDTFGKWRMSIAIMDFVTTVNTRSLCCGEYDLRFRQGGKEFHERVVIQAGAR